MIVSMAQVELLGRREDLETVLRVLQHLRVAEVAEPSPDPVETSASRLVERLDALLAVPVPVAVPDAAPEVDPGLDCAAVDAALPGDLAEDLGPLLDAIEPEVARLVDTVEALGDEHQSLQHYVEVLGRLEELMPDLAALPDDELRLLGLATVALVLDDPDGQVVQVLRRQLTDMLGARHLLVTTDRPPHDAVAGGPASTTGCLLVVAREDLPAVEELLGSDRIAHVDMPTGYGSRSLHSAVAGMRRRLAEMPALRASAESDLAVLLAAHRPSLRRSRAALLLADERAAATAAVDVTGRTFTLRVWVARTEVRRLSEALTAHVPGPVVVAPVARRHVVGTPPVQLRNRRSWGPYQKLVGFLSWPTPGTVDPTGLMAVVLPFLFGVMVGDIVYGAALAGIGWWAQRRWPDRALAQDAGRVLVVGGLWAVLFGVLFGEALGSLGHKLGLPAVWFYRGGPAALEPLLLFALAIGATHILLGVVLGLVMALRQGHRSHVWERAGTLLVLMGLFLVAGIVGSALPDGLLTPAIAAMIVGLVVCCVSHGAMGVLLGPLELLGTVGNILSYLRVAAVGLASVYLANVANELAVNAPLLLGILVAAFLHILNLALAAFSPTVQALRLHYVEFFSKFHDGGGRLFTPLGAVADVAPPLPEPPAAAAPRAVAAHGSAPLLDPRTPAPAEDPASVPLPLGASTGSSPDERSTTWNSV